VFAGAVSSNASSNVGVLDRTKANCREHVGADHPKHRTASDGFDTDRARLLIRGFPIVLVCGQVDQPSGGGPEAAGIEVERREVLLEVDVKPLASGLFGVPGGMADKRGGNAPPLMLTGDLGVEEEGVVASIPHHIDKADQAATRLQACCHPAKAVRSDLVPPPGRRVPAVCCDEGNHLCVGEWSTPAVLNRLRHRPDRPASHCLRTGRPTPHSRRPQRGARRSDSMPIEQPGSKASR
jgi:hypothetical protein